MNLRKLGAVSKQNHMSGGVLEAIEEDPASLEESVSILKSHTLKNKLGQNKNKPF